MQSATTDLDIRRARLCEVDISHLSASVVLIVISEGGIVEEESIVSIHFANSELHFVGIVSAVNEAVMTFQEHSLNSFNIDV